MSDRDFTLLRPWLAEGRRHPRAPDEPDRVIILPVIRVENRTARTIGEQSIPGVPDIEMDDAERKYQERIRAAKAPAAEVKSDFLSDHLLRAERCLRFLRHAYERDVLGSVPIDGTGVDIAYLEAVCALVFKSMQEYGAGLARGKTESGS